MNELYINGCLRGSNEGMTCKEISDYAGLTSEYVSRLMSRLRKKGAKYFIRLKPKEGREFRYQLSKLGIKWYFAYLRRFYLGFDLNCARAQPEMLQHYEACRKIDVKALASQPLDRKILVKNYMEVTREGLEVVRKRKEEAPLFSYS